MDRQSPEFTTYSKIQKLIDSSRFNEAFLLLYSKMKPFEALKNQIQKLNQEESNYKYMLDYMAEGHSNPDKADSVDKIKAALYKANSMLLREGIMKESSDLYSSTKRLFTLRKTTLKQLIEDYKALLKENFSQSPEETGAVLPVGMNTAVNELFNYVWTMSYSSSEDYEELNNFLSDEEIPDYLKLLLISALTLGNLQYFDEESFEALLNIYEDSEEVNVRARTVAAIGLLSLINHKQVASNLKIRSRLSLMAGDEDFKKNLDSGLINILRTFDTNRVDSKMRNEVIPELMKINPEIINKFRNLASDSENSLGEGNPEWEEIIEESGIADKLQEINDMQMDGADVMVTAFSQLKGFNFFSQLSNWFLPFIPHHYELAALQVDPEIKELPQMSFMMCDSDIYSFFLSVASMPEERSSQMLEGMKNQMKEAREALGSPVEETEEMVLNRKIRHTLQDLYRFFKFFRKKNDFHDPFSTPILSSNVEDLNRIMGPDEDNIRLMAEFYFKNKYYEEAAGFFLLYDRLKPGDFNVWEKIGFSYEKIKNWGKAVEWYHKAELINPENHWLIKKLAIALKNSGKMDEALSYYEKALEKEPENYHLLMSLGECLLAIGKTQDALQRFYHAFYLKPEKIDALRAVAWAELMSGQKDKALASYQNLLAHSKINNSDYLNMGHASMASGDFKNALVNYRKFVDNSPESSITNLVIAFRDDSEVIKKLGIPISDLRIIVDKIRYDISGQ